MLRGAVRDGVLWNNPAPGDVFLVIPRRYGRVMELIMNASESIDIEQLLATAGVDFTVVERCPVAGCEICDADDVPVAA